MIRLSRRLALVAALAASTVATAASAQTPVDRRGDPALRTAVMSADRPEADKKRDMARHPAESLSFWGLKPGQTVIDLQPGGGYYTAILSPYAAKTGGRYIAGGSERGRAPFTGKFADPKWGKVEYVAFGKGSPAYAAPGTADVVISAREMHNWMRGSFMDEGMAWSFAALKPGGVLAIEEHRADGSKVNADGSQGYVKTADVIAAAEKAGFKLAAKSEINANPKDTKDHPFGVWTLPPSRQSSGVADAAAKPDPNFDHAKYDAIGESDRMTLRFVKPKA